MPMKRIHVAFAAALLCLPAGCQDYLDVNTNPNAPQSVSAWITPALPVTRAWYVTFGQTFATPGMRVK